MVGLRGLVLVAVCLLVATPVFAQRSGPKSESAQEADRKRQASEHFERGVMLYGDGAHRAALIEFERAYDTLPDYRLLYNIAHVRMLLEDYLGAARDYERYLAEGKGHLPAERIEAVKRELGILRERIGRVVIQVSRPKAKIYVDEVLIGESPIAQPVPLNVGRHRIHAEASDGAVATQVLDLAGGETQNVKLELRIPAEGKLLVKGAPAPAHFWPIATTAAAGVFLAATITVGLYERKVENDLSDRTKIIPANPAGIDQTRTRARALSISTDVLGGATIALAATAVWLWLKPTKQDKADKASAWRLNLGLSGASAVREF